MYAELHTLTNFSFLRGASHPEELVNRAAELGYSALAITDECSVAGIVRAHVAAKAQQLKLIIGSEFTVEEGLRLVLLATNRNGYGYLTELITRARRQAKKGEYQLKRVDLVQDQDANIGVGVPDCLAILLASGDNDTDIENAQFLNCHFRDRAWIAVELHLSNNEQSRIESLSQLSVVSGLPLVASGDVYLHHRERRLLQDTLTAIRCGVTLKAAGYKLQANGERYLRGLEVLSRLYSPELLQQSLVIAERCQFSLDELRYEYPKELAPKGVSPALYLRSLTEAGVRKRWPDGAPDKVIAQIEHELGLIAELSYEPFFLTVYDIVCFARSRNILCQGRGSAANSAVCFCLGITEVDPARMEMLFERFISKERNEPPDIDVDFEHQRREEVIQYIYNKYGRERAAIAATVVTYRPKSAIRDIGKALGMSLEQVDRLAKNMYWWDGGKVVNERLVEVGFDPDNPTIKRLLQLLSLLVGFPRHLSQHVGGFVISQGALSHLVPIENAAMPERTVIQWDKDDLEALGLLKVDCLCLGMLSAIHRAFDLIGEIRGKPMTMATVPPDDAATYAMIQRADTIGVFQIESRAQMSMLPRLRPANYYDLVIQIAIIRPGPIQGQMVHPYLRRREGKEAVTYPSPAVERVLQRTLGVPLFQEQVIKLAMVAAGFTPGEADQLRRSMAAWKRNGGIDRFKTRLIDGMRERGYEEDFAERIFQQIKGFSGYGFPESHAASFALLAYVSCWLKCHEPAAFTCALLNSQPMGFYAPAQLVQDAQRHGVEVLPVDVAVSEWDCSLEKRHRFDENWAVRLGLRMIKGLSREAGERLIAARAECSFTDVADLVSRSALNRKDREALAGADALASLAGNRHQARWQALGVENPLAVFGELRFQEAVPLLPKPSEGDEIVADYARLGLSLRRHPVALLRPQLQRLAFVSAAEIRNISHGEPVRVAGLVISRQRPGTATGVVFVTLEDETGHINLVVWNTLVESQRRELLGSRLLGVSGEVQREGEVVHVIAARLEDRSALLGDLLAGSRDFH